MERLAGVIEEQLANGVVGASVAVVVGDQIVWSAGYGVVDIDDPVPVSPTMPTELEQPRGQTS